MKWIEKFPENVKLTYEELIEFFLEEIFKAFADNWFMCGRNTVSNKRYAREVSKTIR